MMYFPVHIYANTMGCPLWVLRGHRLAFPSYDVLWSLRIVVILTNSVDTNGFRNLGLHFLWLQYTGKGLKNKSPLMIGIILICCNNAETVQNIKSVHKGQSNNLLKMSKNHSLALY